MARPLPTPDDPTFERRVLLAGATLDDTVRPEYLKSQEGRGLGWGCVDHRLGHGGHERVTVDRRASVEGGTVSVAVAGSRTEADVIVGLLRSHGLRAAVAADDAGRQEPALQLYCLPLNHPLE